MTDRGGDQRSGAARSRDSFDVERLIEDLRRANADGGQAAVGEVLGRAVSEPGRLMGAVGEPAEAGLHKLYSGDDLTVLNVIWPPLMDLLPHNHNMWASIGIYTGRENNIIWRRSGEVIKAAGASALFEKEVFALPVDAIHSVTNPIGRFTGAIHVYGGNYFAPGRSEWDAETLHERPFDLAAAREAFSKATQRFNSVPL